MIEQPMIIPPFLVLTAADYMRKNAMQLSQSFSQKKSSYVACRLMRIALKSRLAPADCVHLYAWVTGSGSVWKMLCFSSRLVYKPRAPSAICF